MPIYLKEVANKKKKFTFPSMPDGEIDIRMNTSYQEYNFVRRGRRSYPAGMDKQPIKWSGYFWGKGRKKAGISTDTWVLPEKCVDKLRSWEINGTPLNLIISESSIDIDVTISSFNPKPFGGQGDISYTIEFLPWYDLKIYTTSETGVKNKSKKKKKTSRTNNKKATSSNGTSKSRTYRLAQGETLCLISRKYYGTEKQWQALYNVNKKSIEKAAKARGYKNSNKGKRLYAGTVLTVP